MGKGEDRRRFERVSVDFVTVEVFSASDEPDSSEMCFVINISENGMMFRASQQYQRGQKLRITFSLPIRDTIIRTNALVIHTQELSSSKFVGVQFKDLGIAEHRLLRDFIQSFAGQ
jgi:c-di-GMP-binding flagellar brake protein YcgR